MVLKPRPLIRSVVLALLFVLFISVMAETPTIGTTPIQEIPQNNDSSGRYSLVRGAVNAASIDGEITKKFLAIRFSNGRNVTEMQAASESAFPNDMASTTRNLKSLSDDVEVQVPRTSQYASDTMPSEPLPTDDTEEVMELRVEMPDIKKGDHVQMEKDSSVELDDELSIGITPQPAAVRTYNINLEEPAECRWDEVVDQHAEYFPDLVVNLKKCIPPKVLTPLEKVGDAIDTYIPKQYKQYADEIRGISQRSGISQTNGVSVKDVAFLNVVYELLPSCTSIVVEDEDGCVYHGRTLDYVWGIVCVQLLQKVTINVNFQKGGETVYTGTTYAGYVGLLTGQRPLEFSISLNQRPTDNHWNNAATALLAKDGLIVSFLIRDVLENKQSYKDAYDVLKCVRFIAPSYIIIAGANRGQGAVITRNRKDTECILKLHPPEQWFLVKTNFDNSPPKEYDDEREGHAIEKLNEIELRHSNIIQEALYTLLTNHPVVNEFTTYTTLMSPAIISYYHTIVWKS